jgi:hypothetical protein
MLAKASSRRPNVWNTKTAHATPASTTRWTTKMPATKKILETLSSRNNLVERFIMAHLATGTIGSLGMEAPPVNSAVASPTILGAHVIIGKPSESLRLAQERFVPVGEVVPKSSRRSWWRYVRISVRAMLVIVVTVGAVAGLIVRSARFQREAVAAIRDAGGIVYYDWQWKNGATVPRGSPTGPPWLVDRIGVDYFNSVTWVLVVHRAKDNELRNIGQLRATESLCLQGADITDRGLAHLEGMTNLHQLNLGHTLITDSGLAHLKGLRNLRILRLDHTEVGGAGLADLSKLPNLVDLDLEWTNVGDRDLPHLQRLQGLKNLSLRYNAKKITPAGAKAIREALPKTRVVF